MKLYHLTPTKNVESILEYGLKPSKISLPLHSESFSRDHGSPVNECTYLWNPETSESTTDKLIDDFIYCKHFLHPRNNMVQEVEDRISVLREKHNEENETWFNEREHWVKFPEFGTKLYGEPEDFTLLEIDGANIPRLEREYFHVQEPSDDYTDPAHCMIEKYAHTDKALVICTDVIPPEAIKPVRQVGTKFNEDDTITTWIKKKQHETYSK